MVYCTSTYTIQILYSIKMQIVLCYSEHTVTVLNYKSKHWFVTRGSPAVEIIVRRRDWRRGFQSCCSPWCSEERTVSERGRGWESEGRDSASPQAIEGSAGRLSLACLREMLSDYLCQSRLRIITHLQDLLYLQALHYSFQHLQEPHRCLHPELLNTGEWKTWSGKLCPWGNSHRVVFSAVQMSQEHLTRESVVLCYPWLWQNFTFHGSFPHGTGNRSFDATTCDSAPSFSLKLTERSFKVRAADCLQRLFHLCLSH